MGDEGPHRRAAVLAHELFAASSRNIAGEVALDGGATAATTASGGAEANGSTF
jgi:hypothetical protein